MKKRFIRLSLLAVVIAMAVGTVQAQAPASQEEDEEVNCKKENEYQQE